MVSNQLTSSILTEQKAGKAISIRVSNTQLIQSPPPIRKGLDNSASHLKFNGNVTEGTTGKFSKLLLLLLPNGWQSDSSSSMQSKPRQIHWHSRTYWQFLACRFESSAPWLSNSKQVMFGSGKQCLSADKNILTKYSMKSLLLKED